MSFDIESALSDIAALNRVGEHEELQDLARKLDDAGIYGKVDYKSGDFAIPTIRYAVPDIPRCGIYFLFSGEDLVYVGQSTNIPARLSSHMGKGGIEFDSYTCIGCQPHRLDELEALYTLKFQPKANVHDDGRPKHSWVVGTLKKTKLDGRMAIRRVPTRREYRGRMVNEIGNA